MPLSRPVFPTDTVPCFPLESILAALGRSHVDYLSLDAGGSEMETLRGIPFQRIRIDVLSVAYSRSRHGKEMFRTFMESRGYMTRADISYHDHKRGVYVDDFIFTRGGI